MKSFMVLLTVLLCFAFVDCAREYQPRKYQPKSTANYKEFDQEDTSKKEENCSNAFVATDEDFENIKCFSAFNFFAWYCPSHIKYQTHKHDVKYATEQYWGEYQKQFDTLKAGGCESKEGQMTFDKCLQKGAYLPKFVTAPKVFFE